MFLMKSSQSFKNTSLKRLSAAELRTDDSFNDGNTALMRAVYEGEACIVELLLELGANVNARGRDGDTALMCAVAYRETKCVEILLKAGADVR